MNNYLMTSSLILLVLCANCTDKGGRSVSDSAVVPDGTQLSDAGLGQQSMHVDASSLPTVTVSGTELRKAEALGRGSEAIFIDNAIVEGPRELEAMHKEHAAAAYMPGRVLLSSSTWDPHSLRSQSYLVHELVHHAQFISGRQYPCRAAREREAYTVQNRWLVEPGGTPIVTEKFIDTISACRKEPPP